MKFGNYNLANATEKHNRLFFARLKKVKNTSNYIVGKFNNQINTIRKINRRKASLHRYRHYTDSPLSYRASLFDNRRQNQYHRHLLSQSDKCRELREKLEKYRTSAEHIYETCEKYVPDDFHRPTSSLFDRQSPSNHCVFDKVKFSKINNAITGKRSHKMLKNVFFTIKSNQCQNISQLYDSMEYEEVVRKNSLKKSYKYSPPKTIENLSADRKLKSSLTSLLRIQKCDEKTELEVLKNYFESMTYSDICNDDDFKNYLKKKNYQDAIDYIYSGHSLLGSSLREESMYGSVTDVLKRYYDLDLDIVKDPSNQNDCDSVKNEKRNCRRSLSIDRRKYYNKENSEFFCKSNKEFDDYYKRNIAIFYEATKTIDDDFLNKDFNSIEEDAYRTYDQLFYHHNSSEDELLIDRLYECKNQSQQSYNTMPEKRKISKDVSKLDKSRISFDIDVGNIIDDDDTFYDDNGVEHGNENDNNENDNSELKKKYQTYPLKRKTKRNYKQLLRYCEKSLANYSTVADMKLDKWYKSSSGKSKEFSEKAYNKIIKAFVKLRGFENVETYVQYHYGRILDKSFDTKLKTKLREAISKRNEQLVISRPILRTTTQSSVIANNRLDSLPPPYTSIDSDNNYFYKKHQSSSDKKFKPASTVIDTNKKASSKALDDCFKHYDYIESNYGSKIRQPSSTVNGNELQSQFLFRFVEDMHDVGIKFDEILIDKSQLDDDDDDEEEKTYENFLESENYPLHCDMHDNQDITNNDCFKTFEMVKTNSNSNTQINHMKISEASMCNDNIYESIENAHRRCKSNINNYQHQQRNSSKNNSIIHNRSHENETNAANEKARKFFFSIIFYCSKYRKSATIRLC